MNLSLTMEFVLLRAAQEAKAFSGGSMGLEHLFLGLLKLPEVKGEQVVKDPERSGEFDREAAEVAAIAREKGWDTAALRRRLRSYLSGEQAVPNDRISYVLGSAGYHAQHDRGSETITAADVLGAILRHPSAMIQALLEGKKPVEAAPEAEEQTVPPEPELEGIAFLPQLTSRIRTMRYQLLDEVFGQDHAVYALSEGLFSAEVLAASDNRRKGPRAVFVFAGPPGVGKTFMAERAAAALNLPFRRFDMSSYADHQAHMNLIGFAPSFKDAKPGQLTGFVKQHPRCLLLLDEIEKAHLNTIQLFLQILDGGRLHDDYSDEDVDFRECMVIFTTNAGRQLYQEGGGDLSALPRQSVLSALETDVDPTTRQPYFPAAICSRLSAGYVLLFNHLNAYDRERICRQELNRFCGLFRQQYDIPVDFDRLLPMTLLFAQGSGSDARTLRAQTELFCKNELYRLCAQWGEEQLEAALQKLNGIHFSVPTGDCPDNVRELFVNPQRPELLLCADEDTCQRLRTQLPEFHVLCAPTAEAAFRMAGQHEPLFVLSDLNRQESRAADVFDDPFDDDDWDDELSTRLLTGSAEGKMVTSFDDLSAAAPNVQAQVAFLKQLRERLPEVPVYLLESGDGSVDEELMGAFTRIGVRGRLQMPEEEYGVFSEQLQQLAEQCYLQSTAAALAAEQQILSFTTRTVLSQDGRTAAIELTELRRQRAVNAEDVGDLLEDVERSKLHFSDVIGAQEAREELSFFVEYLKHPRRFLSRGLKPPKGVLLYGPPGTGKTLLARAMAGEAQVAFIATEATSFVTRYQGSGPEAVRNLFRKARRYAPSIVFIDEIDAIGRQRGDGRGGHGEEMALNALLTEMDGFRVDPRRPVFVLAATNFNMEGPNSIDPALSRRFDRKILVELPDRDQRLEYLNRMLGDAASVTAAMRERLANRSAGLSLADLCAVLEQAARQAVRRNAAVCDEDLDVAYERIRHGSEKNWGEGYMERVAYHESGHALLCALAGRTPAYLTIVARGDHGGYMEHADGEDTPLRTREELLGRIRTALGGRAAELVRYGPEAGVSTGASGDLTQATELAAALLLCYGMDKDFGLVSLSPEQVLNSPLALRLVEKMNALLKRELELAVSTLQEHRRELDLLAQTLLRKNKLTGDEIAALLGQK